MELFLLSQRAGKKGLPTDIRRFPKRINPLLVADSVTHYWFTISDSQTVRYSQLVSEEQAGFLGNGKL